jgi:D-beta-D-heptose 7-phosphate kinase/D-beta-D-heptose 1-phosphate adenosyltransferase
MPTHLITRDRVRALLDGASHQRIVVVGDAMLDVYLRGDVDRISPEAPVPVLRVRERRLAMGGAANVAQNVAATGARAVLVATVGKDTAADSLRHLLEVAGGDARGLVAIDRPTTTKTRIVARAQQVVRVDEEVDADCTPQDITRINAAVASAVEESDALILEDYNKGVLVGAVIEHAIRAATRKGIPIVVDPKYRNFFSYKGATIFKPNRRELEAALGAAVDIDHPETLPTLVDRLGVQSILLTLSERGMALIEGDAAAASAGKSAAASAARRVHRIPTTAREVYDVVGAGDTVTAYLAVMLASGASALEAAVVANFAAGVEVGKLGAATVTPAELLSAYEAHTA